MLEYLNWLKKVDQIILSSCGKPIEVYEFYYDINNDQIMSEWATHFRNHYCLDSEIDMLKAPNQTRTEYLKEIKFPTQIGGFGAQIRAGDFAEIFFSDFLQYLLQFYIPRTRYDRKGKQNLSPSGSDIIGFKMVNNPRLPNKSDIFMLCEVKASLSKQKNVLQEAIDHSVKDILRKAVSLNGMKERLLDQKKYEDIEIVNRFQNDVDHPYKEEYGASTLVSMENDDYAFLTPSSTVDHPHSEDLFLIAISGNKLMELVHHLYERAANEA